MLSLTIPTLNEAENLPALIQGIFRAVGSLEIELVIVDDDSPDGTGRVAEEYSRKDKRVRVIRRISDRGLSSAVVEGFRHARGRVLGVLDADLSHDSAILPEMMRRIQEGADAVVGSRRIAGGGADRWPWHRRLTSNMATAIAKAVIPLPISDPMSGYFLVRRQVFERVEPRLRPEGYKILLEILWRARPLRIEEVPFVFKDRRQGHSKLTPTVMFHFLKSLLKLRFDTPPSGDRC